MLTQYKTKWESYWSKINTPSEVFWNVTTSLGAELDWERFRSSLTYPNLPLIDFGCGDGTQTQFFAQHFEQVIGLDVSEAALELASRQAKKAGLNITYQVIRNQEDIHKIHARLGDANIYMRGVLHQIQIEDRPSVAKQLQILQGKRGTLYLAELAPATHRFLEQEISKEEILPGLLKVLESNITPSKVTQEDLQELFPPSEFTFVESGEGLMSVNTLVDGKPLQLPSQYAVIRRL